MTYEEAKQAPGSAIRRVAFPLTSYWKEHLAPLDFRITQDDQQAEDWEAFDPNPEYSPF